MFTGEIRENDEFQRHDGTRHHQRRQLRHAGVRNLRADWTIRRRHQRGTEQDQPHLRVRHVHHRCRGRHHSDRPHQQLQVDVFLRNL